jgi:hypothetical protein
VYVLFEVLNLKVWDIIWMISAGTEIGIENDGTPAISG